MNASQSQPTPERENFIPGIYNYCDRWCERCTLTSRCMTFAAEQRFREGEDIDEVMNEMFWDELDRNVGDEHADPEAESIEIGLGFDSDDDDDDDDLGGLFGEADFMEEMEKKQTEKHPCITGGSKYFDLVHAWFQGAQHLEELSDEQFSQRANFGVPQADAASSAATVRGMLEVITFYHMSIFAKLRRAVHGKSLDEVVGDDYPSDSDGSAKVALIGIDRSIAAWMTLQRCLPEQEDAAIRALLLLNKLRSVAERTFPNARLFVRPGFDDEAA